MHIQDLESPAVVISLDRVDRNITRHIRPRPGIRYAPHQKAHKLASVAALQRDAGGAHALTVHRLSEAEAFLAKGFRDFRIAYPTWAAGKKDRLAGLAQRGANLAVHVDSTEAVEQLALVPISPASAIDVFIDLDVGFHRGGVAPDDATALLAVYEAVSSAQTLNFVGIAGYRGIFAAETAGRGLQALANEEADRLMHAKTLLERAGADVSLVAGGPSALMDVMAERGVSEIRAGAYVLGDLMSIHLGLTEREDVAIRVVATVVSRAPGDNYVLDAGAKTFGWDYGTVDQGLRHLAESQDGSVAVVSAGDEHSIATASQPLRLGQKIVLIPRHAARTMNLHDRVWIAADGDVITGSEAVIARGKSL